MQESFENFKQVIYTNQFAFVFQVAQKFYSILVLKKFQVLQISQQEAYADILITKGPQFDTDAL